jgi:hypothetical protein
MPIRLHVLAALFWLLLFGLAALNGVVREFVFSPALGAAARPLSGFTLILVLAIAVGWFVRRAKPLRLFDAALIGIGWFALTLGAETLLLIKAGRPASEIMHAFTWNAIAHGELFGVAAVFVAAAPAIFAGLTRP